jgi:hypothetical protein
MNIFISSTGSESYRKELERLRHPATLQHFIAKVGVADLLLGTEPVAAGIVEGHGAVLVVEGALIGLEGFVQRINAFGHLHKLLPLLFNVGAAGNLAACVA